MENQQICIVDYGLGNLRSVAGAVEKCGHVPVISRDPAVLRASGKLILPGVGAFPDGMANLEKYGLVDILNDLVLTEKKHVLGICLGFQLLAKSSTEHDATQGLGWIDATISRIQPTDEQLKVPHVGWNDTIPNRNSTLFQDTGDSPLVYYVHSFAMHREENALPSEIIAGTCHYGAEFIVAVENGNVFGTQFHPEKSQLTGLQILKNFLNAEETHAA